MCKLSKNKALGYLTLLAVALLTAGRSLIFLLPQVEFSQLFYLLSQLAAALSCGLWLLGRIFDELLHKNRAEIFRYAASAFGLLGFAVGLMHLIVNPLSGITLAVDIAFALFALVWTIFIYLTTVSKKGARAALWSLSICSAASLALFCAAFALDVYNGFIYLPSDAVFLYALMLLMETLGLFAPVIYALYESLSRLRAQYKKPSAPRRPE